MALGDGVAGGVGSGGHAKSFAGNSVGICSIFTTVYVWVSIIGLDLITSTRGGDAHENSSKKQSTVQYLSAMLLRCLNILHTLLHLRERGLHRV
jgi:hypothetical protein